MKILSIETSSNICSVAILENDNCIKEISIPDLKTHSVVLMPTISQILNEQNLTLDNIDLLCCSIGPGSFTGIRIGISTMKAFGMVRKTPIVGVSSLLGLTYANSFKENIVCSLIDAKNDNVYCGIFDENHNLLEDYLADSIEQVMSVLEKYSSPLFFVGDGALAHKEILQSHFPNANFATDSLNYTSAKNIGIAGYNNYIQNIVTNYHDLEPMYLKKASAKKFVTQVDLEEMKLCDLEEIKNELTIDFDDFWNYNILKQELENENSNYVVAKAKGNTVGFGGIWQSLDETHITNIVVKKDLRAIGIGSFILEKLIEMSKQKNSTSITLEVRATNMCAISLYKKYNFEELGRRKMYYQNPAEDAIIMTLKLN